jgi:hypothetical protein
MVRGAQQALTFLWLAAALAIAGGCGGGGGDGTAQPTPPGAASGSLDAAYATGGRLSLGAAALAASRDGSVFAAGRVIVKYDAAGQLVAGFVDAIPAPSAQTNLVVDSSGNVYSTYTGTDGHFVLAKRNLGGLPVVAFGQAGQVDLSTLWRFTGIDSVFVDDAGNVYVFGFSIPPNFPRPVTEFVAKLDAFGRPDSLYGMASWGGFSSSPVGLNGDWTLRIPSDFNSQSPRVIVDPSGNVFATGPTASASTLAISKYDRSGQVATGFVQGPKAVPCDQPISFPPALARDPGGNLYFGGTCRWGSESRDRIFVVSLDASGNVLTYGDGPFAADFFAARAAADPSGAAVSTRLLALQSAADGGLYVAATASSDPCAPTAIVKLGRDGKLAGAFGDQGVLVVDVSPAAMLAVDASGRLYVGGRARFACSQPADGNVAVYRYNG